MRAVQVGFREAWFPCDPMSRLSAACLALLASALLGCAATSPYDRAWVGHALYRETGHAPGDPTQAPTLPPSLRDTSALGEDDVVAVALWNSPAFGAELAQLGASRADLAEAGALPNPTFSLLFPIGPRQIELGVLAPIAALVQRPFRVKAAKLDVERAARGLVQRGLDLVREARLAWIDVEASKARAAARRDLLVTWQNVAKVARARHEAGDAPAFEAAVAEADATDAEDQSDRAGTDLAASVERLRVVMGLADGPLGQEIGTRSAPLDERAPPEAPALVALALAARPDVRAAEIAVEAAGERLGWEKSRIFALLGRFDLKPIGSQGGPPLLPLPGVQVELPIFNWNPGGIGRAEAELSVAMLRYRLARQGVATDIRVSRLQLVQSLASLRRFQDRVLPLLEKAAGVTVRAFEAGAEPYLAVLEATRRLRDARLRLIELEAEVRRARANLDRHLGMKHEAR
jgi:outer membrane protein, heavy metal efflux system